MKTFIDYCENCPEVNLKELTLVSPGNVFLEYTLNHRNI